MKKIKRNAWVVILFQVVSNIKNLLVNFVIFALACPFLQGQVLQDENPDAHIASVVFGNAQRQGLPMMKLYSGEILRLQFDFLDEVTEDLSYRILPCHANWELADVAFSDYAKGSREEYLQSYQYAFGTYTPYLHYQLSLPNSQLQITQSGNYILQIFSRYDNNQVFLQRRFVVFEERIPLDVRVSPYFGGNTQQVSLKIQAKAGNLQNANENLQVALFQNKAFGAMRLVKPTVDAGFDNYRFYFQAEEHVFPAYPQFYYWDMRSWEFPENRKQDAYLQEKIIHYHLQADPLGAFAPDRNQDLRGGFYLEKLGSTESHTQADYVKVYFKLKSAQYLGKIYLYGAFSQFALWEKYALVWHEKEKFYTLAIDFKQGLYNYQYAKLDNGKIITLPLPYLPDTIRKNSYTVLLYYQNPMKYRSEVVGLANVLY
jgi:hypothetical protein